MVSENQESQLAERVVHDYRGVHKFLQSVVRFLAGESKYTEEMFQALMRDLMIFRQHLEFHFNHEGKEGLQNILVRLLTLDAVLEALRGALSAGVHNSL